jgi:hypothetical protein
VRRTPLALVAVTVLGGCAGERPPASIEAAPKDDTALDDAWLASAPPESEPVAPQEARRFADAAFGIVERQIYDASLVSAHGRAARDSATRSLVGAPSFSRQRVVDVVNEALRGYGVSHLGIAIPTKLRARFAPHAEHAAPDEAVTSELRGDVGVIRIRSFLVPEIRHDRVREAFEKTAGARTLLLDLRGNGGGSASSVSYTAQYLVGPNVLAQVVRTRQGQTRTAPYDMKAIFPDADNAGSTADLALNRREGLVRWWTPADAPPVKKRPAFVLIDQHCASACEVFAAMMADTGAATIIGQKTAGEVLAGQGIKTPWNGYLLVVPFGTATSPKGKTIEGVGVAPSAAIEACADAKEPNACLEAAVMLAGR